MSLKTHRDISNATRRYFTIIKRSLYATSYVRNIFLRMIFHRAIMLSDSYTFSQDDFKQERY